MSGEERRSTPGGQKERRLYISWRVVMHFGENDGIKGRSGRGIKSVSSKLEKGEKSRGFFMWSSSGLACTHSVLKLRGWAAHRKTARGNRRGKGGKGFHQ